MPPRIPAQGPRPQREPQRNVVPELRPLATYAAQRALQGRPLELEALKNLRKADDTVRETRAMLRVGRGNVDVDIALTNHESSRRTFMAREVARNIANLPPQPAGEAAHADFVAATAVVAGAGNCFEIAQIATRLQAGKLEPQRALRVMSNAVDDHVWTEQVPAGGRLGPTVVIDPWMRGPAVMLEDASVLFTNQRNPIQTLASANAPAAHAEFHALVAATAGCSPEIEAGVQVLNNKNFKMHPAMVRQEEHVTSAAFRQSASAAAARVPHPSLGVQLATVAAARELGANVRGAAAFAGDVVTELAQPPVP